MNEESATHLGHKMHTNLMRLVLNHPFSEGKLLQCNMDAFWGIFTYMWPGNSNNDDYGPHEPW